jgi:hypothetical protein
MGLVTIIIPSAIIPATTTPKRSVLELKLRKGPILRTTTSPRFPLTICGQLPRYTADVTLSATNGATWERKITEPRWYYKDCPGGGDTLPIKAEASDPWFVDRDIGADFHSGLRIVWSPPSSPGGDNYHSETWNAAMDTFTLYCAANNGRGSNSHAFAQFAWKKKTDQAQCGQSQRKDVYVQYADRTQVPLDKAAALGTCAESLKTPSIIAKVEIKNKSGSILETVNLAVPTYSQKALHGELMLSIDEQGLLSMDLRPSCRAAGSSRVEPSRAPGPTLLH